MGERALVLSYFSLRHASLEQRVAAAASAGFAGIGLYVRAYEALRADGWEDARIADLLERHGVRLLELEAQPFMEDGPRLDTLLHVAGTFGARHLQAVPPFSGAVALDEAARAFGRLCDRAADVGLAVGIEFLPFTCVPDARAALAIVERADRPNGGLCVDSWHVFRGAGLASLDGMPAERVVAIQLDDGPLTPVVDDYLEDTLHHRDAPGAGEFDLHAFLRALPRDVPVSVEVIDDDLDVLPPDVTASRLATATRRLLAEL